MEREVGFYSLIQAKLGLFEALSLPQSSLKETREEKKKTLGIFKHKTVFL